MLITEGPIHLLDEKLILLFLISKIRLLVFVSIADTIEAILMKEAVK